MKCSNLRSSECRVLNSKTSACFCHLATNERLLAGKQSRVGRCKTICVGDRPPERVSLRKNSMAFPNVFSLKFVWNCLNFAEANHGSFLDLSAPTLVKNVLVATIIRGVIVF